MHLLTHWQNGWDSPQMKPSTEKQSKAMQCKEKQSRGKQKKKVSIFWRAARKSTPKGGNSSSVPVAPRRPGGRFLIAVLALTDPSPACAPPPSPPPFEPEDPAAAHSHFRGSHSGTSGSTTCATQRFVCPRACVWMRVCGNSAIG